MLGRPIILSSLCVAAFGISGVCRAQDQPKRAPRGEAAKADAAPAGPQLDPKDPIARIRDEGQNRSQVMKTLSYLTDVIGPRLTGSPALRRANEWTRDKMKEWGLENAHLEPWGPFGRGWTLKRFSAQLVEPQCVPLIAFPKAWTPGLDSPTIADVIYVGDANDESALAKLKGKIRGKIVLTAPARDLKAWFDPPGSRMTEKDLLELADAGEPGARRRGGRFRGGRPQNAGFARQKAAFIQDEAPLMVIDPSFQGDGGTLFVAQVNIPQVPGPGAAQRGRALPWDKDAPKISPQMVVAAEHYNRMVRMIQQGDSLKMALELSVEFNDTDLMAYNTVAEIAGTDRKDEVVMLGGHIDSWHSGTGATDNGAGVACAMEAVRILKALDLKPRRTIRVGLWSGEEQGLFGSRAYVKEHFGDFEEDPYGDAMRILWGTDSPRNLNSKPEYDKFCAYFNLDNGTGKVRGVYMEGNESVRSIFRRWLAPVRDLGATTLSAAPTFGTDHQSFDAIGLPAFQFIQDRIEYETRTHHSNQDVFDRIQADDMKQASIVMAAFVYDAAMREEKLPRKPRPGSPEAQARTE
jgi:hypothetical protein